MTVEDTKPDPKTWSLKAALIGQDYAKDTVPVFLDESAMLKFGRVTRRSDFGDDKAEKERTKLLKEYADKVVWITVQSVPRYVRENLDIQMLKDYPTDNLDAMGIVERNKEFTARWWQMYVAAYKGPDGVETVPDRELIDLLVARLPDASFNAVEQAIKDLRDDSKSGYESITLEPGFLSQP